MNLTNHKLPLKKVELEKISQLFAKEISLAEQAQEKSSLNFDKNLLFKNRISGFNKKFLQVIYVGGSHIESALIDLKKSSKKVLEFKSFEINSLKSSQELLEKIADLYDSKADVLNINLAAHLKLNYRNHNSDSTLVKNHNEHNLEGLVGKNIGLEVEKYLWQKYNKKVVVSSSNNLVSLGFLARENKDFNSLYTIAGVVASGLNFGFYSDQETFVNLESGNFKPESENLGEDYCENSLYKKFNQQAKELNLNLRLKKKKDFVEIIKNKEKYSFKVYRLAKNLLQKSAQLSACQFYGIVLYKFGQKPVLAEKIKLLLEGSLFWDNKIYKETFLKTLNILGFDLEMLELVRIKNGFILGSGSSFYFETKVEKKSYLLIQKIYTVLDIGVNVLRGPPCFYPA